jgi:hypothetical protein
VLDGPAARRVVGMPASKPPFRSRFTIRPHG